MYMTKCIKYLAVAALAVVLCSCGAVKKTIYFQDANDSTLLRSDAVQDMRLKPGDKLSIIINSKDPELANLVNLPMITTRVGTSTAAQTISYGAQSGVSVYTVNPDGTIVMPIIGSIQVGGLTRAEVATLVQEQLTSQSVVMDATVTVEFVNLSFSVLGEIAKPGRYTIAQDHMTILEAISNAGDLTIQGERRNVKVFRQLEDGSTKTYCLNLLCADSVYSSPAYYLKQNDVIYVSPNAYRARQTTVNGNTVLSASFWVSVSSLLTTVISLAFTISKK